MNNKIKYYTAQELAKELRVNIMTIYRYVKAGKLKAHKIGKEFRIYKEEFDRFLNETKIDKREKNPKKVKKYGLDLGKRGIYDIRNPLNDLTGREWIYFLNSIRVTDFSTDENELELWKYLQNSLIETRYSTNGKDSFAHDLRKIHPSPKPPQLMKELIEFFTKRSGYILDPFMGVGGTLLGASLSKRKAVGIDLCKNYIDVYKKATEKLNLKEQTTIVGDARNIDKYQQTKSKLFDAIITDPPYANLLSKKRTGGDRTKKIGTSTPFTDNPLDLGNFDYKDFLPEFRKIIERLLLSLKPKGYFITFIKDLQSNETHHNMLHADIVNELIKISDLSYKGYKIWYDKTINLYPYGYPFSFVANQLHQFILVFRKERKK